MEFDTFARKLATRRVHMFEDCPVVYEVWRLLFCPFSFKFIAELCAFMDSNTQYTMGTAAEIIQ